MLNLTENEAQVCSNAASTSFNVSTNNTEASGITFVYYTSPSSNPYDGAQTGVLGTATGNGTTATLSGANLPTAIGTYYIYAILSNLPSSPTCRPFAGTTVEVIDCSCRLTSANLQVFCNNNGTPVGAADDYIEISIRPTGQFIGFNGYTYSGAFTGTASYGVTTYLQSAPGTAGGANLNIVISDVDNPTCTLNVLVTNPGICSTPLPEGSVGNFVWNDDDADGNQDAGELGINGVTVELWNATTNALVSSTTTANNGVNDGAYNFVITTSGNYYIKFPTIYGSKGLTTQTTTIATDGNSDANTSTGISSTFAIDINGTGTAKDNPTIDAGYTCPGGCIPLTIQKTR